MRGLSRLVAIVCVSAVACGGSENVEQELEPLLPEPDPWLDVYAQVQAEAEGMDVASLLATYPVPPTVDALSYDPSEAVELDAIEQQFPLSDAQRGALNQHGFVVLADAMRPTFGVAYQDLYDGDLPVLVTADSILYALHRSFDEILMHVERSALAPEMDAMLAELHAGLKDGAKEMSPRAAVDLDVYLTVARRLSTRGPIATVTGDTASDRVERIMLAIAAESVQPLDLFGRVVDYDYSQLKPRGHYEDEEVLQRYFQAMMWLGRTEMQIVTYDDGKPEFNRRAFDSAFALRWLLDGTHAIDRWTSIDRVMRTMIGEPDSMSPADMPELAEALGVTSPSETNALSDDTVYQALVKGRFGVQRIMSQIMYTDPTDPPLLLPRVHLLLGQRFTIDSYVFNNVTYDRVQDLRTRKKVTRMLPDELDVQFVLGNNEAGKLLEPQLQEFGYQGILHELRFLVDQHPRDFWEASFYNGWLAGIRALNAPNEERAGYPEPMRTKAWQHKTLQAQAASRAELRHDTLLYVKQSYSLGDGCEYPDGYVEPAAEFYASMGRLGDRGRELVDEIERVGYDSGGAAAYFTHWSETMATLEGIARKELAGEPLSGDEIAFLGATIEEEIIGCGEVEYDGWYAKLFFDAATVAEARPTIADVHTAPTDAMGNPVGWVLHAATGHPAMMVMTVPQCDGTSNAYVGPVSSYYGVLTDNFQRKTDSEWELDITKDDPPPSPTWTLDFRP
jgi:hypothetical protein